MGEIGSQLRELELFYSEYFRAGRHDPSTLSNVIACCTSLESLFLDDILIDYPEAVAGHLRLSIGTLHRLKIIDTRGDLLRNFLRYLSYPPTCVVDIHCYDPKITFARRLLHRDSQPYQHLCTADEIRLSTSRTDSDCGTVEARTGGVKGLCINTVLAGGAVSLHADLQRCSRSLS